MKKYLIIIIAILTFSFINVNAKEITTYERNEENRYGIKDIYELKDSIVNRAMLIPYVDSKELIYDFSNLLTDEEYGKLQTKIKDLSNNKNFSIVIVTTDDIKGLTEVQYADDFYDYNDFNKNGVLLLIDMNDRYVYISTSGEGQLTIDEARIETILDEITPSLSNSNYYKAIDEFADLINKYLEKGPSNKMDNCYITDDFGNYKCYKTVPYYLIIPFSLITTIVITIIGLLRYKKVLLVTNANLYLNKSKINLGQKIDNFVSTNTIKHYISSSSSSSGGSSSHHSSSGSSHGGGGRHF